MLLIIDNYDSFTYNLYQYFCELGASVKVVRNDEIDIQGIEALNPTHLVISPGPCTPNEAGISLQAIEYFAGKLPILGVCLGHQAIAQVFGGEVVRARQVMHGKTSPIRHNGRSVFKNLNNPLTVTRYHSLVVKNGTLPDVFELTAWTELPDGSMDEIMGYQHKTLPIDAVQFHPATRSGKPGSPGRNHIKCRTGQETTDNLRAPIGWQFFRRMATRHHKTQGYRRVEMPPGNMTDSKGHGQNGQTECQGHTQPADADIWHARCIDGGTAATEDQPKRPHKFSCKFLNHCTSPLKMASCSIGHGAKNGEKSAP